MHPSTAQSPHARQSPTSNNRYARVSVQAENPFSRLVQDQTIAIVPSFTLESGVVLHNVPVAYKTYGSLAPEADNAMVICHALTGSSDIGDWWGPLLGGQGRAFDVSRFFVVCFNSLGSPYGSASPVTNKDGSPEKDRYGPEFPLTTVRDDVNLFKLLLDDLGVRRVAAVVGGSMGGMLVLEFAYFGRDYVRSIIPIATSARYSAWGISWNEAQRQSIYSDPKYDDGYYSFDEPPSTGLGAARMSALLTYRSRDSFESRFGRNTPDLSRHQSINGIQRPSSPEHEHWAIHNEGHKNVGLPRNMRGKDMTSLPSAEGKPDVSTKAQQDSDPKRLLTSESSGARTTTRTPTYFSAQSYLRYQGEKFIKRFDANCYIAITRKMDTHDVSRNRASSVKDALAMIEQPALILGIESDGLFTFAEQQELAEAIPNSVLKTIDSLEGHDAFLLEFEQVNSHILEFLRSTLADIMERPPQLADDDVNGIEGATALTKTSTFGEAEVGDMTAW